MASRNRSRGRVFFVNLILACKASETEIFDHQTVCLCFSMSLPSLLQEEMKRNHRSCKSEENKGGGKPRVMPKRG